MKRVLLKYQGDIYSIAALHWLKQEKKMEVLTYTPQIGGREEPAELIGDTAMRMGVDSAYFGNLEEKYYTHVLTQAIRCSLRDRNGSFLTSGLSRPVIAREMADLAVENSCAAIAFSEYPQSMDQLRYRNLFMSLAPGVDIMEIQAEWDMRTFSDLIQYAKNNNLPVQETRRKEYAIESNLWGNRIRCGKIEDLWRETPEELYKDIKKLQDAPDRPRYAEIHFREGLPEKLNGKEMDGVELVRALNELGRTNGIGRMDIIGEELLGMKTRIIQEAAAAQIVLTAHKALEDITVSTETLDIQNFLAGKLAEIVYEGTWFSSLREAICAFVETVQKNVTGVIRLKLYKGNCIVTKRKADRPIYEKDLITHERESSFPAEDIQQFLNVWVASKVPQKGRHPEDSE
mgnify:CR=1 FL=1